MPGSARGEGVGSAPAWVPPAHLGAMTFLEYLSVIRRRWIYLLVGVLAGAIGGFLTAPGTSEPRLVRIGAHESGAHSASDWPRGGSRL